MQEAPHPLRFLRCPWWWIDAAMVLWIGAAAVYLIAVSTGEDWTGSIVPLVQTAIVALNCVRFNFDIGE